jgi:ankyrin repeat protein
MTMREAPALPLSPTSALRHNSLGTAANAKPHKGWSPLHTAAERGDLDAVQAAVEAQKIKVDSRTSDGTNCTALWLASQSGRAPVVKYLLEKGAGVDHSNSTGVSPLHAASSSGKLDVVTVLLAAGAAIEKAAKNGTTPLYAAVAGGHADVVELLIDNMAQLTVKSKDGKSLLCAAAISGHEGVMDLLLVFKTKLDLEGRDEAGHTPL